jgi:ketosteroid isomerase-like protein
MQSDAETIRQSFGLLRSESWERVLPLIADDFEMVTTAEVASEPDVYRGPEGVRRWWESFLDVMDDIWLEARSFDDRGDGRVVIEFLIHARGQASGIETKQPAVTLASAANGKLTRLEFFTTVDAAREAAGSGR